MWEVELKLEIVINHLSPNWVQKYWVIFSSRMVATDGARKEGIFSSDRIGGHLCDSVAIFGEKLKLFFVYIFPISVGANLTKQNTTLTKGLSRK